MPTKRLNTPAPPPKKKPAKPPATASSGALQKPVKRDAGENPTGDPWYRAKTRPSRWLERRPDWLRGRNR